MSNGLRRLLFTLLLLGAADVATAESTYQFAYGGRLVSSSGKPVNGPVSMKATFYHDGNGSTPILAVTDGLSSVALQQGIFQIDLQLSASDYAKVFSDVSQPVWIQITDLTNSPANPFPLQQIQMTPYAARVPVDGATVSFNSDGQLTVGPTTLPGVNQFLTKDSSGNLIWAAPTTATSIQGTTISSAVPTSGQILGFSNGQWVPISPASSGVLSLTASAPLSLTGSANAPSLTLAPASGSASGYLSATDWQSFASKLSLGGGTMSGGLDLQAHSLSGLATPLNASDAVPKSYVDTNTINANGSVPLTGPWNVGAQTLTNVGSVVMASARVLGLSGNSLDPSGLVSVDKGKMWFNTTNNQIKYFDGTTIQTVGATGAGISSLNGLNAGAQTFANSVGGSTPQFSSSGSTHTLSIPMASGTSATAGLLSNADYASFVGKISSFTAGTGLSGGAITNGGTISLPSTGTVGTYSKIATDAQGRVVSGTSLSAGDLPALNASIITSGTLAIAVGGTGVSTAPADGQLLIGGGGGYSLATLSQGATDGILITNASGTIALDTAQDIRTSASPNFAGLTVTGLSSGLVKSTSGVLAPAAAGDVTTALGYTPVKKAGDTMSGSLNFGSFDLVTTGNVMMSSGKVLGLSGNTTDPSGLSISDKGKMWFNSLTAQIKYFDGATTQTVGTSAIGIANLNGLSVSSQTFASGTAGASPTFNSSGSVHTLNIPMASGTGVIGGLITNSDYASFSTKVSSVTAGNGLNGGTITGAGTISLPAVGTAGTYAKVITDAFGRVTSSTTLLTSDVPPINASVIGNGTLAVTNGGTGVSSFTNNGVLIGSGATALSATAPGAQFNVLTVDANSQPGFGFVNLASAAAVSGTLAVSNGGTGLSGAPANGQIPVGNGSGYALATLGQGPTQGVMVNSGSGTISLDTVQDIRTSASPSFSGLTLSGNASAGINSLLAATHVAGSGDATATPLAGALRGPNAAGFNLVGKSLTIAAGNGTGSGGSGSIFLQTAAAGGSSSSADSMITALSVSPTGLVGVGTSTPATPLDVVGAITARGTGTPSTSSIGTGVLYFDSAASQFKISQSGSAYVPLASGGTVTSVATGTGLTGGLLTTAGTLSLATVGIAGSYAKVITDALGRVVSSTTLLPSDIPPLTASAITGGTLALALVPSLPSSAITSGTLALATVPNLPATAIGSGTINVAQLPNLSGNYVALTGSTMTGVLNLPSNGLIAGTSQLVVAGGNVGIGTTSPAAKLEVGTTNTFRVSPDFAGLGEINAGAYMGTSSGDMTFAAAYGANGAKTMIAYSSNVTAWKSAVEVANVASGFSNLALMKSGGNVGIGTTSPNGPLQVSSASTTSTGIRITNTTASSAGDFTLDTMGSANSLNGKFSIWDNSASAHRLVIDTIGNVGIGTTSPASPLHIYSSANSWPNEGLTIEGLGNDTPLVLKNDATGGHTFVLSAGSTYSGVPQAFQILDYSTGSTRLAISNGGNVGIGTTAPVNKLEVAGTVTVSNPGTSPSGSKIELQSPLGYIGISISEGSGSGGVLRRWDVKSAGSKFAIADYTAGSDRVTVDTSGNVGIGTTAPTEQLTLNSSSRSVLSFGAGLYASPPAGTGSTSSGTKIRLFENQTANHTDYAIGLASNELWQTSDGLFSWYTNNGSGTPVQRMQISSAGNVGIGTTSPTRPVDIAAATTHSTAGTASQLSVRGTANSTNKLNVGYDTTSNYGYVEAVNESTAWQNLALQPSGGNVGIGTTVPAQPLQVTGITGLPGTGGIARFNASSNALVEIGNYNASPWGGWIQASAWNSNTTSWPLSLQPIGGNVGIGTAAPMSPLHIESVSNALAGVGSDSNYHLVLHATDGTSGNGQGIAFTDSLTYDNVGASIIFKRTGGQSQGELEFYTKQSTTEAVAPVQAMVISNTGNVGIGTTAPSNTLQVIGSLCVKSSAAACAGATAGTIYATTTTVAAADLAEHMPVTDASLEPGDVVAPKAADNAEGMVFEKSTTANQTDAAGVVSTRPGVILGSDTAASRAVALAGRVPVKVTLEGGVIAVGDYLVPSSSPGKAMRARGAADAGIIGVALSNYDGEAIPSKPWADGIAHEVGHQVMMLVHVGAGSQLAVAQLQARTDTAEADAAQLRADMAQLKAEKDAQFLQLKNTTEQLKKFVCRQAPKADVCQ